MSKLGAEPKIKFKRDGERYIVFLGDDRIGFVRKTASYAWNAADTFMEKSVNRVTRIAAAAWLRREFQRAVREGRA
jgi:hypothetical protein